jgi:hypothetical protein
LKPLARLKDLLRVSVEKMAKREMSTASRPEKYFDLMQELADIYSAHDLYSGRVRKEFEIIQKRLEALRR